MSKDLKERNQKEHTVFDRKNGERLGTAPSGSQLPILLTTLLLLYGFQAALALGLGTTAGSLAEPTRQARQLDLLHVF